MKFSSIILNNHPFDVTLVNWKIMQFPYFIITRLQYAKPNDVHVDQHTCMDNYDTTMQHFVIMGGGGVFHLSLTYVA